MNAIEKTYEWAREVESWGLSNYAEERLKHETLKIWESVFDLAVFSNRLTLSEVQLLTHQACLKLAETFMQGMPGG